MIPRMLMLAVLVIESAGLGASVSAAPLPFFASLPLTDVIRVRLVTNGCCDVIIHEFTIRSGGSATVAASLILQEWSAATGKFSEVGREDLDAIALTGRDLDALDALLDFYRSQPGRGNCPTTEEITVDQLRDGRLISSQRFVDPSCRSSSEPNVLTFKEILDRLEQRRK